MTKIIACVDGSKHLNSVCDLSSWINKNTKLQISLLHIAKPHNEIEVKGNLSGSIGFGAKSGLLKELSDKDEEHGKLEQQKGKKILDEANRKLIANDISNAEKLHRRGSLIETLSQLESNAEIEIIVIGKKGENNSLSKIGSNLEAVIRKTSVPLMVATQNIKPIKSFLIAYDGSDAANKALSYVISNKLFRNLNCHLVKVDQESGKALEILTKAQEKLENAGFKVNSSLERGKSITDTVSNYITKNNIDLLVVGVYGHSKIRNFIIGSTTTALINKSEVPTLLFR